MIETNITETDTNFNFSGKPKAIVNIGQIAQVLAKAYILIEDKVKDEFAVVTDNGTMFNKDEVLREIKSEMKNLGYINDL